MKKIFLSAAAMCAMLVAVAQTTAVKDSSFKSRKLKLDEISLVSSYYRQNGDHASVTGGIGSEKLSDIANVIDISFIRHDNKGRKNTLAAEFGIDHYTSASSDQIDLKANTSASHADTRIYPSANWTVEDENKGRTYGVGVSVSSEYDYLSLGANVSFAQKTNNKNGEFSAKFQAFLDQVTLITPVELRPGYNNSGKDNRNSGTAARNTFDLSLSYSQIINQRLQVLLSGDAVQQNGYLSLPFHRVYFKDNSVHQEKVPDSRTKIPVGIRANYFAGDKFIFKTYYRFYKDNFGIQSNTGSLEMPVKINPFLSISPFYRYYEQTASKYFAPYATHTAADEYYTSNYDFSKFASNFFGIGFRSAPPKGVFGNRHLKSAEMRYGHYSKNVQLNSDIISLNLNFK